MQCGEPWEAENPPGTIPTFIYTDFFIPQAGKVCMGKCSEGCGTLSLLWMYTHLGGCPTGP